MSEHAVAALVETLDEIRRAGMTFTRYGDAERFQSALAALAARAQEAEREADQLTERLEKRLDEDSVYRVYDAEVESRQAAECRADSAESALRDAREALERLVVRIENTEAVLPLRVTDAARAGRHALAQPAGESE